MKDNRLIASTILMIASSVILGVTAYNTGFPQVLVGLTLPTIVAAVMLTWTNKND